MITKHMQTISSYLTMSILRSLENTTNPSDIAKCTNPRENTGAKMQGYKYNMYLDTRIHNYKRQRKCKSSQ